MHDSRILLQSNTKNLREETVTSINLRLTGVAKEEDEKCERKVHDIVEEMGLSRHGLDFYTVHRTDKVKKNVDGKPVASHIIIRTVCRKRDILKWRSLEIKEVQTELFRVGVSTRNNG